MNLDAIIAKMSPPDVVRYEHEGIVFEFRAFADLKEQIEYTRKAQMLVERLTSGKMHPAWEPYLPLTAEEAGVFALCAERCRIIVDGKPIEMTDLDWLKLLKSRAGVAVAAIASRAVIDLKMLVQQVEQERIEEEKKDSGAIRSE